MPPPIEGKESPAPFRLISNYIEQSTACRAAAALFFCVSCGSFHKNTKCFGNFSCNIQTATEVCRGVEESISWRLFSSLTSHNLPVSLAGIPCIILAPGVDTSELTPPWIQPIVDSSQTFWSQRLVESKVVLTLLCSLLRLK